MLLVAIVIQRALMSILGVAPWKSTQAEMIESVGSLAAGYVVLRTRSLVPCIVAHSLANLPAPPFEWSEEIVLLLAVAVVLAARRSVLRWVGDLVGLLRDNPSWGGTLSGLLVLVVVLAAVFALRSQTAAVAFLLLLIGVGGDALDRYATRSRAPATRGSSE